MDIEFTIQVNFVEVIDMWKCFIRIWSTKKIMVICKRLFKSRKKWYFLLIYLFMLFAQLAEDFALIWTMFLLIKICPKFVCNTSDGGSFHGQGHYIIK